MTTTNLLPRLLIHVVNKCSECPFHFPEFVAYSCRHPKLKSKHISSQKEHPTPEWCPLEEMTLPNWKKLNDYFDLPMET